MRTVLRGVVGPGQRVLHPVDVVAVGIVLARMRAAAFLAVGGAGHRDGGLHDQVVVFERLDQVGVPDQRAVGDARCRRVCFQMSMIFCSPSSSTGPSRNTAQLVCMTFCILRRSAAVGVPPLAWRNLSRRDSASSAASLGSGGCALPASTVLAALQAGGAAEHHEVDQRVGAQAVGAVHRHAGGLADGHQARHHVVGVAVLQGQHLAVIVRGDAAHVVVHGRQHRDRLAAQVDAGEDLGVLGDARQALVQGSSGRDGRGAG